VSVEGLNADITFKKCDFNNLPVTKKSPNIQIKFVDCINLADPPTEEDIDESLYMLPDGEITE